ncbi:MAG: hypothetical protein M3340_11670 [Actinomycetota bacterium]|nr:hypothetical protein [Actinomycetota bacterium]
MSESAVRNWRTGQAKPRPDAEIVLDDLRAAAQILLDGAFEPERIGLWLKSRNREYFDDARPIDILPKDPMRVLTAAHREVLEQRIAVAAGEPPVRVAPQPDNASARAGN